MEDKYLDKVFQDKLESTQQFDFDEAAWDNLAARLDDETTRRIIPWQWFAAAGIVLPLLLSSTYLFFQLKKTTQTIAKLEAQVDDLAENIPANEGIGTENLLLDKVESEAEKVDEVVVETRGSKFENSSAIIAQQAIADMETIKNQNAFTSNNLIDKEAVNGNREKGIIASNHEDDSRFGNNLNYLNKIVYTSAGTTKSIVDKKRLDNWVQKERTLDIKESAWNRAKTNFIPIGVEIGTAYQTGVTLAQDLAYDQNPRFNNRGVEGTINFVNNIDLTMGLNHSKMSFESETIGQDFPHVIPNNPTDIFQKVVVSEDLIQVPVGLKYSFGNYDALFSPFVEIGAIARKVVQKNHTYEYKPNTPGDDFYTVSPRPKAITESSLEMNTVTGAIGVAWNPNSKFLDNVLLQAEIFTAADIEDMNAPVTMVGVGVSASYMF